MFTVHIRYKGYANPQIYRLVIEVQNCFNLTEAKEKAQSWFKRQYASLQIISIL